jgi:hypothetical protein
VRFGIKDHHEALVSFVKVDAVKVTLLQGVNEDLPPSLLWEGEGPI